MSFHHVLNWPDTTNTGGQFGYVWPPFQSRVRTVSKGELLNLRRLGFDFIRLTADPSIMIVNNSGDKWAFLQEHFKGVINSYINAGFVVLFDLHPVGVNPAYVPERLVGGVTSPEFVAYAELVGQVASALKDYPQKSIVFELMNEPGINSLSRASLWQPMLEALYKKARAAAPDLTLMLSGVQWSDYRSLDKVDISHFKDNNVFYTFHYYEPHIFTHQGADMHWVTQYMSGIHWPQSESGIAEIVDRAAVRINARTDLDQNAKTEQINTTIKELKALINGKYDADHIEKNFKIVADWADRNAIARDRIVLGEFGCSMQSNGEPVGPDRIAWLSTIRRTAEANGFPWCYWGYKSGNGDMKTTNGAMEFASPNGQVHPDLIEPLGLTS
jgi:aryl-phospho-beta-D-glucosidase BglC (GH1 family)